MKDKPDRTEGNAPDVARTLSMLWVMYLISSCGFVALGYLVLRGRLTAVESEPAVIVALIIGGFAMGEVAVRLATKATDISDARKRLMFSLIALSIVELLAIGGIVVSWWLHSSQPLLILSVIALFVFYRLAAILR